MSRTLEIPTVYFYCPSRELIESVPGNVKDYWPWINAAIALYPIRLPSGDVCDWDGPYSWTVQTWMHLRDHGFRCQLVSEIPTDGVILAHSDFWPRDLRPTATQLFVEIKPDRQKAQHHAQFTLVQSSHDPIFSSSLAKQGRVAAIRSWPQPGLIRRDPRRLASVEHAAFLGNTESFLAAVSDLREGLQRVGIDFTMPPRALWHDYSQVDLVIAVRDASTFSAAGAAHTSVARKPANKLTNAWLAEVPAILSAEPSYLDVRLSADDFIAATNIDDIVNAAYNLKVDSELYRQMVENSRIRGAAFGVSGVLTQWIDMIERRFIPAYQAWRGSKSRRLRYFVNDRFRRVI